MAMNTRYKYFDDVRDALGRAGLTRRRALSNPYVCLGIGCAAGLVIGAGLTMLVAPRSGRETRAKITDKAREMSGRGKAAAREISERAERAGSELQEGFERAQSQVQQPSQTTYEQEVIR